MKTEHVIVIGGTRGLGRAVVSALRRLDYQVSVIARSKPIGFENYDDVNYAAVDLCDEMTLLPTLDEIIQTKGRVNHLLFLQRYRGKDDSWHGEIEVSLNATRKIIDYLTGYFVSGNNCSIGIVSSVAGIFANDSQPLSYSIAKAGLNHMVKYYSAHLGKYGIRVNGILPIGFIKEESKQYYLEENKMLHDLYCDIVPLGRMCVVDDIVHLVLFLCSQAASFLSGQNIVLDGGLSARSHESMAMKLEF